MIFLSNIRERLKMAAHIRPQIGLLFLIEICLVNPHGVILGSKVVTWGQVGRRMGHMTLHDSCVSKHNNSGGINSHFQCRDKLHGTQQ